MELTARKQLVEKYRDGYRMVAEALDKITDRELDVRPAPGKWSAREIVHHLADSEMTSAIRLRRLIAEDRPAIIGTTRRSSRAGCTTTGLSSHRWKPSGRRAMRRRIFSTG
jgi:hypothetical protein